MNELMLHKRASYPMEKWPFDAPAFPFNESAIRTIEKLGATAAVLRNTLTERYTTLAAMPHILTV